MFSRESYKPMTCPVCKRFYFTEFEDGEVGVPRCSHCGWRYDADQQSDINLKCGENDKSLREYRIWFSKQLSINPNYDYEDENYVKKSHLCPVCGKHNFKDVNSFDICPVCGWVDDVVMEEEPSKWAGDSNDLCLNDFRVRFQKLCERKNNYEYKTDLFLD